MIVNIIDTLLLKILILPLHMKDLSIEKDFEHH